MKLLNKFKITLFISSLAILLINIKVFAVTGVITEVTVNMREKASTDSKRIMYVTQDDKVDVLEKDGEWYKIKYKNKMGYVFGEYIKVDDSQLDTTNEDENQTEITKQETEAAITEPIEGQEKVEGVEIKLYLKANAHIRIIPNIASSIIYNTVKADNSVKVLEKTNNWAYVNIDNIYGWVLSNDLLQEDIKQEENTSKEKVKVEETKKETSKALNKKAYIKCDTVNLRKEPSTSSKVLSKLKLNDEIIVIEEVNSVWSKVKVDGKTGYISKDLISDKKQTASDTKGNNTTSRDGKTTTREDDTKANTNINTDTVTKTSKITGADIVAYAKKYLGYKYVYGNASPETGFDCSGFTSYVYKHFGYSISRSSVGQASAGVEVKKSDLQLGDLLIFKNTAQTKIGHVGIYIGNNQFIHASTEKTGVKISGLNDGKYPQRYVTARRILK